MLVISRPSVLGMVILAGFAAPPEITGTSLAIERAILPYMETNVSIGFPPGAANLSPFEKTRLNDFVKRAHSKKCDYGSLKCEYILVTSLKGFDKKLQEKRTETIERELQVQGFDPEKILITEGNFDMAGQPPFKEHGEEAAILVEASPWPFKLRS